MSHYPTHPGPARFHPPTGSSSTGFFLAMAICVLAALLLHHVLQGALAGQRVARIDISLEAGAEVPLPAWLLYPQGENDTLLTVVTTREGVAARLPPFPSKVLYGRGLDERQSWRRLDHILLSAGMRVRGAGLDLAVAAADGRYLEVRDMATGRRVMLNAGERTVDLPEEDVNGSCPETPGLFRRLLTTHAPWLGGYKRPPILDIGGTRACGPKAPARWPMPSLSPQALSIHHDPDGFRLERRLYTDPLEVDGLAVRNHPLMDMLRVGEMVWRVERAGPVLRLHPVGPRFFVAPDLLSRLPAGVSVEREGQSYSGLDRPGTMTDLAERMPPSVVIPILAVVLAGLIGLAYLAWDRGRWRLSTLYRALFLAACLIPVTGVMILGRSMDTADAALELSLTGLVWVVASLVMAMSGRLNGLGTFYWCGLLGTVLASLLAQMQFCTDQTGDHAAQAYRSHLLFIALAGLGAAIAAVPDRMAALRIGRWLMTTRRIGGLPFPPVILLSLSFILPMMVLALFGSEQGVGWVQPSELAKFATPLQSALLSSWLIVVLLHGGRLPWPRVLLGWVAAYVVPIVVSAISLRLVHDTSPVVIIFVTMAMTLGFLMLYLSWLEARGVIASPGRSLPALLLFLVAVAGGALVFVDGRVVREQMIDSFGGAGTTAARLAVYFDPAAHPYTGAQYLAGLRVLREAPLLPDPAWMTGPSMMATRIPLAHNDMVAGYLVGRNGVLAAAVLVLCQTMSVMALAFAGIRLLPRHVHDGDVLQYHASRALLGMLAISAAIAVALQNLISWSNLIGILPLMGQSMMLVSTGGSNILLFALPAIIIGIHTTGMDTDNDTDAD